MFHPTYNQPHYKHLTPQATSWHQNRSHYHRGKAESSSTAKKFRESKSKRNHEFQQQEKSIRCIFWFSDVFFGFPMKSVNFFWFSDEIRLLVLKLILDRKYSEKGWNCQIDRKKWGIKLRCFFGFPMKSVTFFWFSDEIRLLVLKLILDRKYSEKGWNCQIDRKKWGIKLWCFFRFSDEIR